MKQELRNKDTGNWFIRYWKSFCHALSGIWYALRYEHNMYIILLATIVVISSGIFLKISVMEWLFCILSIGLIFSIELINSAIEALCDLVTLEKRPLIKIAKDTAAGASLVLSLTAVCIGLTIFIPKIMNLF